MKKLLLGFVIVVTLCWSPTFKANPPDNEPIVNAVHATTTGVASWYGERFQGRTTANGEVYDMNGLTAAHRDLPMGTRVEITNVRNGRSVTVRINDRGPSIRGRMIDVSKATAQALGFVGAGLTTVSLEVVALPASGRPANTLPIDSTVTSSEALSADASHLPGQEGDSR